MALEMASQTHKPVRLQDLAVPVAAQTTHGPPTHVCFQKLDVTFIQDGSLLFLGFVRHGEGVWGARRRNSARGPGKDMCRPRARDPRNLVLFDMPTFVYVVRHGETFWNRDKRLQGQSDSLLNAKGRAQAEAAGAWFGKQAESECGGLDGPAAQPPFAALYSSDLTRAKCTAEPIGRALGERVSEAVARARAGNP